jgi:hypothetical protein
MIQIQEGIDDDDENMMYHVNLFDDDYYVDNNGNLLKTTLKFYWNKSSYDIKEKYIDMNLYSKKVRIRSFSMRNKSLNYEEKF